MTLEARSIHIESNLHIIAARAEVRSMARKLGFNTMDQARISLATSSLAHLLDLGGIYEGEINFEETNNAKDPGLQVACIAFCGQSHNHNNPISDKDLSKLNQMVDELNVERLPSKDIKVSITKWKSSTL